MATNEVIGKWFSGQPTRGSDPPLESAVMRPHGMLGAAPAPTADLGNGNSLEAKLEQCMMSIRMVADMIMEDRAQDTRKVEDWMNKQAREQVELTHKIEIMLDKQAMATSHREHGWENLQKSIRQEFQSQQLWEANQFVMLRSSIESSHVQEIERAVGILTDGGQNSAPREQLPTEQGRKPPHPGTKAPRKRLPRTATEMLEEGEVENPVAEIKPRAHFETQESASTLQPPSLQTKPTTGEITALTSTTSVSTQNASNICGIDWERKKLNKFLRRMHNIKAKHSFGERVMQSQKFDRDTLTEITQKPSGPMTKFADSTFFAVFSTFAIISNSVWIGYQTNFAMQRLIYPELPDVPGWHQDVNRVYAVIFAFELIVRLLAYRIHFFFSPDWKWNLYDAAVVITAILEEVMESVNMNVMRAVRIFRVVRVVRIVRMLRFFMRFRHLVCTVLSCANMLFWTCLFLGFLIYLFAIIFMQGIITFAPKDDEVLIKDLGDMYGGVDKAMYTLFQSLTHGRPWVEFMDPMARISWVFIPVFCGYLILILFGVLNVLTGVFVGETKELQERDRDLAVHNEMAAAEAFCQELKYLLGDHGMVEDDTISIDVFDSVQCEDVEMFLQSHGLDSMDAHELFLLMDVEDTGVMAIQDFVYGCQRLKSPAKGMDLVLMYEQVVMVKEKLTENKDYMRSLGRDIHYLVSRMSTQMTALQDEIAEVTEALDVMRKGGIGEPGGRKAIGRPSNDFFI